MVEIGKFNELKIIRKADFGYYLDAGTGNTDDDILLPIKSALNKEFNIGDEVNAFIYRDSKDRIIATLKSPLAKVGDIAYLEVVAITKIGSFVNFGLERDILVPFKQQNYRLELNKKYLFYIYLDKTNRIAASTNIDRYLCPNDKYIMGDEVTGIVYGFQTNRSAMVAVENKYIGVILPNEYFNHLRIGEQLNLRIKRIYEDGKLGLTPRSTRLVERNMIEDKIMNYLKENNGFMPFNDKSSPEDIKNVFGTSKNYFKNALGGLLKEKLIYEDEKGTWLK